MKSLLQKFFTIIISLSIPAIIVSQNSYLDHFDSYPVGKSMNALQNNFWSFTPSTYTITNEKSYSGNQCAKLTWIGTSSNTFFKIPQIDSSYEVRFKFWLKSNEAAFFNCFQNYEGISFLTPGYAALTSYTGVKVLFESNKWNDFRFVYLANTKTTYYYLNDVLVGSDKLRRPLRTNFDINLYPNSGFYIDDFSLKVIPSVNYNNDIGLIKTFVDPIDIEGANLDMGVAVHNFGNEPVEGFIIEREYNGQVFTQTFDETIKPDTFLTVVFKDTFTVKPNFINSAIRLKFKNQSIQDDKPSDNVMTFVTKGVKKSGKKVLLEYVTGTWCGSCPAAVVSQRMLKEKFGDQVSSIFAHAGDIMELPEYDFPQIEGIPSGFYNRIDLRNFFDDFEVLRNLDEEEPFTMKSKLLYHESEDRFTVHTEMNVLQDDNEPLYHNIVIVEDSIRNSDPSYRQSNFYAGGIFGPMGGFENLPGVIPAELMVYSNVPRVLVNGLNGEYFSSGIKKGEQLILTEDIPMNINQTGKNFYIYHIIYDFNRKIKHFQRTHIPDVLEIISNQNNLEKAEFNVYPNPVSNYLYVNSTEKVTHYILYNQQGSQLNIEAESREVNEDANIRLDISSLATGVYLLKVFTDKGTYSQKICKI